MKLVQKIITHYIAVFAFTAVAPLAVVLTVLLSVAWNDEPAKTGGSESHKRSAAGIDS